MADITYQQYIDLLDQLKEDGLNIEESMRRKLLEINSDFILPSQISSLSKRVQRNLAKAGFDPLQKLVIQLKHEGSGTRISFSGFNWAH